MSTADRLITVVIVALLALITQVHNAESQKLRVDVYYETLCPDSMYFIRRQLYLAMVEKNFLQYTDLRFVPYGKVSSWTDPDTNVTTLYCQHYEPECEKNALHACIVEHNSIRDQLVMFNCLMRGYSTDVDECASRNRIDLTSAKECKNNRTTVEILRPYGVATNALDITFVPTTTFDQKFEPWRVRSTLYNFVEAFCKAYREKFSTSIEGC